MPRPYVDGFKSFNPVHPALHREVAGHQAQQRVEVVRHDNPRIPRHMRKVKWDIKPATMNDPAQLVQVHSAVDDVTEQHVISVCLDGQEPGTRARVVP